MKYLAIMLWLALAFTACTEDDPPADPPTCDEVGCPDTNTLICKSREICACPQPGADPIDCRPVSPLQ